MVMRGAAPTVVCPRCGAESPPSDERLAHCATCKLGFDPRAEPVRPVPRSEERTPVAPPRGIRIARTHDEVAVRWSFSVMRGIAALLLGTVSAAMVIGNLSTPGEVVVQMVVLGVSAVFLLVFGLALVFTDSVLRIDGRRLTVRRAPIRGGLRVSLLRSEIEEVRIQHAARGWQVIARLANTKDSGLVIAAMPTREAAECVAEVVREALESIPPG